MLSAFAGGRRKAGSIVPEEPVVVESVSLLCNEGDTKWVSEEARYFGFWAYRCQSSFSWLCSGTIKGRQR
jgi:hypothetical protein